MKKVIGISNKIVAIFILIILFLNIINSSKVFARTISIDLHTGVITTISDSLSKKIENGVYKIRCAGNEDYLWDISGNSLDDTAQLQVWLESGSPNQKFYISYDGRGYYKISVIHSAKIIDVNGASTEANAKIQQYEDNSTSAQRFKIEANEDGTYTFIAKCSGMALDVNGEIYENGTVIQQYTKHNGENQKFKLEKTELIDDDVNEGIISIKSAINTKMHLDVINCLPDEGNKLHLWTKAATLAQRFELHRVGENEVRIRTAASGGWLKESSKESGADVIQSGNSETPASDSDTWKLEWNEGLIFINKESGLVLTIDGDLNSNGTELKVKNNTNSENQKFLINVGYLIPSGYYTIQSKYGTLLDVSGNTIGTNLRTWSATGTANQVFALTRDTKGYKIRSGISGWIVDVSGGSMDNAAIVHMQIDAGTTSERWKAELKDGGYVTFRNVNSGLMLNVHLFNSNPGAEINQGLEDHSDAQLWKLNPTQLANSYVRRENAYYYVDGSGSSTLIARNLGGWDFTDWDYVMRMRERAIANNSATDWYATIDCDRPCRDIFFHRENGQWVAVAGYYAVQGFITLEGGSRTIPGIHRVDHKYETSVAGPGYITSYYPHWINGIVSPNTDDAQVFHGSWARGSSGYSTHGCSAVTYEYSKWIYENIPLNTSVDVVGNATGIPSGADPDMPSDVQVYSIVDPFV